MSNQCDILVFMNAPSPYWLNFAKYLDKYYKINFIFYSTCSGLGRPSYWDLELPKNCEIVSEGVYRWKSYFYDRLVNERIEGLNPKVVISQGINLLSAHKALKFCNSRSIHFSIWNEIWRNKKGDPRVLLSNIYAYLFSSSNSRFSASVEGKIFWQKKFNKEILLYQVPGNVDEYLNHKKELNAKCLNLLFGHRLIEQYNPFGAIEIASIINRTQPVKLFMNASGNLRNSIDLIIKEKDIKFVDFIEVSKLSDLGEYYRLSHFSISPCYYSQGNIGTNEALASGCPIVISDKVRYHDLQIYESEVEIGYILPLDYGLFADKIMDTFSNKVLYSELSDNSKLYVKECLSNSALLEYYESIFVDMGVSRKQI